MGEVRVDLYGSVAAKEDAKNLIHEFLSSRRSYGGNSRGNPGPMSNDGSGNNFNSFHNENMWHDDQSEKSGGGVWGSQNQNSGNKWGGEADKNSATEGNSWNSNHTSNKGGGGWGSSENGNSNKSMGSQGTEAWEAWRPSQAAGSGWVERDTTNNQSISNGGFEPIDWAAASARAVSIHMVSPLTCNLNQR